MLLFRRLGLALRSVFLTVVSVAFFGAMPALASELEAPSGPVLLTVTGDIARSNGEGAARFDMAMLQALPARSFATTTIWTEGKQEFVGVSLDVLLAYLGIREGNLRASAVNDYAVSIPVSVATPSGPMLAYLRNGEEMSRRDKGPLWIVFPYDDSEAFRSETVYSMSIWQLDRINVDAKAR